MPRKNGRKLHHRERPRRADTWSTRSEETLMSARCLEPTVANEKRNTHDDRRRRIQIIWGPQCSCSVPKLIKIALHLHTDHAMKTSSKLPSASTPCAILTRANGWMFRILMYGYGSLRLPAYLFAPVSVCLSVRISIYLPICLSVSRPVDLTWS